jgi:hypothetical protein
MGTEPPSYVLLRVSIEQRHVGGPDGVGGSTFRWPIQCHFESNGTAPKPLVCDLSISFRECCVLGLALLLIEESVDISATTKLASLRNDFQNRQRIAASHVY